MKYNIEERRREENGTGKDEKSKLGCNQFESEKNKNHFQKFYENQIGCKWYSSREASAFLSISENALRILVHRDKIPFYKFGRRLRFKAEDLQNLFLKKGV